jgi:hypothetical protein
MFTEHLNELHRSTGNNIDLFGTNSTYTILKLYSNMGKYNHKFYIHEFINSFNLTNFYSLF